VLGGQYQPLFQRNTFVLSTEQATSVSNGKANNARFTSTAHNPNYIITKGFDAHN
jgi:hypothetical protein